MREVNLVGVGMTPTGKHRAETTEVAEPGSRRSAGRRWHVFPHAFMTERYLREIVVPTFRAGQEATCRPDESVQIAEQR